MTRSLPPRLTARLALIAGIGALCALATAVGGAWFVRARLGGSDAGALRLVEAELRQRVDASSATLALLSSRAAAARGLIRSAPNEVAGSPDLFDALARAIPDPLSATTGVTVYDAARNPIAWAGRVFEFPATQPGDPGGVFVQADPFGLRLVRIEALVDRERVAAMRPPIIVAEQRLGDVRSVPGQPTAFLMQTRLAPVTVTARSEADEPTPPDAQAFVLRTAGGQVLLRAVLARADLERARTLWQGRLRAAVGLVLALTLLAAATVVLEIRRRLRTAAGMIAASASLAALLVAARVVLGLAGAQSAPDGWSASPVELTLTGLLLLALAWLVLDLLDRWRIASRRLPPLGDNLSSLWTGLGFLAAGALSAGLMSGYAAFLRRLTAGVSFDVLHFSLHPFDTARLTMAIGLVLLHAGVVWGAAAVTRLVAVGRRRARSTFRSLLGPLGWCVGALAGGSLAEPWTPGLPAVWLFVAVAAAGLSASVLGWPRGSIRRASQAARLGLLYIAFLLPAVATYPLLHAFAAEAKERLIADTYGPLAASQRDDLKLRLARTLEQIDARPIASPVTDVPADASTDSQAAFDIWRSTDLDAFRMTGAIEIYGANGRLASRFALRLPEAAPASYRASGCDWDFLDEVSPIGSSERHVLRASRALCTGDRRRGTIVVRVMLDYRTLPFIRAESPYLASLGPDLEGTVEGTPGRDVEFVAYGWSRAPLATSGPGVWPLADDVFDRLVRTREPFWETIERQGTQYRVHFRSDRGGIYALGYPRISLVGHLVNLAELVLLVGVAYVLLLVGATVVSAMAAGGLSGRALLREVRSSFYRKLVAAFVAGAAVPVIVLAIATRTYFAAQARATVEAEAVKTATVAQRLVEDYALIQQRATNALDELDDQTMVLVGRAIDQPVNLFERSRLRATSERDLFASALLTPRTSAAVYRSIVLDRLPAFVGEEEVNGSPYLVAAAPVRTGDREGIVTVPQTLRQREIEGQIDELSRRVVSAAVLFVLVGAAVGYWMAERIADPVNRLTRATRRIARGDLDARIAATSSDELRRLVDDFNRMAADLKRQRSELERTQRLEAWADMARQVAHDIKNPLTPIQLSAEHAQRVNLDRGRPLSPVLDECVAAILSQVRLLRQISAEFSSFASSPTARPESTDIAALIEEVVEPYRVSLTGRVAIDVDAAPGLPRLPIDRMLFARALTNIIENALHAMPGAGRLAIAAHTAGGDATSGRAVVVRVRDTGLGMDAEALRRIFEPYFSTKATGTGLGLTIAKRNVELNGGRIGVDSERGVGTTVTITLPCPS